MYCKNCGKKLEDDWAVCPYCNSRIKDEAIKGAEKACNKEAGMEMVSRNKPSDPEGKLKLEKFNFTKYLLLSLVTFGIYSIVVLWRFTKTVNILCDGDEKESSNYIIVFLLSLVTMGVYGFYWIYRQAERLQDIAPKYNCTITTSPVSILLWDSFGSLIIVGQFIAWHHMFRNINKLIDSYSENCINHNFLTGPTQKRKPIKMIGIIAVYYLLFMLVLPFCALVIRTILITNELEAYEAEREAINKEVLDLPDEEVTVGTTDKENKSDSTEPEDNVPNNKSNENKELPEKEYYDSTITYLAKHPGMCEDENVKAYGEFTVRKEIYISDWNEFIPVKYDKPAYDEAGNEVGPVTTGKVGYVEGTYIIAAEPYIQADRIVLMETLPEDVIAEMDGTADAQSGDDYNFIGVEGSYNDFTYGSAYSSEIYVYISNITNDTFEFVIFNGDAPIFAHNVAAITGSNTAVFSGTQYTLQFIWSSEAELTITGFDVVEGMTFINNGYLQVS